MSIRIENLRKQYGAVQALNGLTLDVQRGAIFGFLGPNGAGKSTTVRLLTGLARPTGGTAWVAGIPIAEKERVAQKVGYLPEEPAFYPWLTPVEFLEMVGGIFGQPAPERAKRARALAGQVGLEKASRRRIGGFSRGMRQRLGLAQALMNQPEVLLLDEPASALDPAGRKEVLDLIESLRGQITIFMSTHILADVERVCDSVGIIRAGQLVVEANQAELLERYRVSALEVSVEPEAEDALAAWAEQARRLPGVAEVQRTNGSARISVTSLDQARSGILALAAQTNLPVRRIEIVTPTLEDIFLQLVTEEKVQA